jgi:hypothetical protein
VKILRALGRREPLVYFGAFENWETTLVLKVGEW